MVNARVGLVKYALRITLYGNNLTSDTTPDTASPNTRLNDFVADWIAYRPAKLTFGVTIDYAC